MPSGALRHEFAATGTLFVDYYIYFNTGWEGSQQAYHPHMMMILSNLDDSANAYSPLADNYLDTYLEFVSDVGSPYTVRPHFALQDEKNVNTSGGTPPDDLSSVTENRSVNYCNTPTYPGVALGTCYADVTYYSANTWWNSTTPIVTIAAWHHVQVYLKMNSIAGNAGQNDGVMQEWIDGVQVMSYSNMLYRTNQNATMQWAQFAIAPSGLSI